MGYYNPIYIYGVDRFLADAMAAGIDGLIVVDLPPEMDEELCIPALKAGINFIRLATPTTDDKRLPKVLAEHLGLRLLRVDDRHHRLGARRHGQGRGGGQAHQEPHRPAGLRRFRRQDRRAGAGDRRVGRRRRRRHGDRQCGRQCRSARRARRPPTRPRPSRRWSAAWRRACARRALLPPNSCPIFIQNTGRTDDHELDHQLRPPEDQLDARPRATCRKISGSRIPRAARWSSTRIWRATSASSRPPAIT